MKKSEQEIAAITLDKNDSDMFNAPKGYHAGMAKLLAFIMEQLSMLKK